jgi:uncharacterized membrane protein YcaP (DUF421 family)
VFEPSEPWWELLLRGATVYVVLLALVRLSGKRTVGEFTPFDLVVVVLIGESAQGALVGSDQSVSGGLLVAGTLVALNYVVGFVSARSKRFDKLVEGEAVILLRRGVLQQGALRRNNVPESDVDEAIRGAGLASRADVDLAVLETDGEITVVPARGTRGRADSGTA